MLSLSPRFDLYKFQFPKDFLVDELKEKYAKILNQRKNIIIDPTEFLNESIQGVELFGINDSVIEQKQIHRNTHLTDKTNGNTPIQRIEPDSSVYYRSSANPLEHISKQITLTIRHTQGFLSYFMMLENWFHLYLKENTDTEPRVWYIDILNDAGVIISRVYLYNPIFNGLDSLQFSYNKVMKESSTFNATFNYSNINYEFIGIDEYFKNGLTNQ